MAENLRHSAHPDSPTCPEGCTHDARRSPEVTRRNFIFASTAATAAVCLNTVFEIEPLRAAEPPMAKGAVAAGSDPVTPNGRAGGKENAERSAEENERLTLGAKEYIRENLKRNRERAEMYQEMLQQVREFAKYSGVEPMVFKCMDGRTQTNDHKWIPPTVAKNRRSEGGRTNLGVGNLEFTKALNTERLQAEADGKSLLIIQAAHRSKLGTGCAAFEEAEDKRPEVTNSNALEYMHHQTRILKFQLGHDESLNKGKHAVISGMNNTDTGAMQLFSNGRQFFSAEDIMHDNEIMEPSDVFDEAFIKLPIAEEWAHGSIRGKTPEELLDGEKAPFFQDMRVKIAFEAYLMRLMSEQKAKGGQGLIQKDVLAKVRAGLADFNEDVSTFLTYMCSGNVAYATHYRNLNHRLAKEDPAALRARVSHGELKVAYSFTGHDLEERNSLILIKPGSGDEEATVGVGKRVLLHNLETLGLAEKLPPIVHINIELTEPVDTWAEYVDVVARMRSKIQVIEKVFGTDVRMFTTYSYNECVETTEDGVPRVKQFMPLNAIPGNPRILIDQDIGSGITKETFSSTALRSRERAYTLQDAEKK